MIALPRIARALAIVSSLSLSVFACAAEQTHPNLVLTKVGVETIKANGDKSPSFQQALAQLRRQIDASIEQDVDVPVPADAGGGYTHEQHKRNQKTIHGAATLYQLTGEQKYLELAKNVLFKYAELYPGLGEHPKKKEQAPGRLFWQSLNEAVWLVYVSQAYDSIVDGLSASERSTIEGKVLRPMANFLSEESPQTFNKIHNHGTWATAAVGMTGYALGDQELVEKALLGLDKSGDAGFIKQLYELFSPDGYYTEGPYYQRYALMPFVLFAQAIENNQPERGIFKERDGILLKAIYGSIQLSYNDLFFPINDALKDKGLNTIELVHGVSIAYGLTKDPSLLSIAQRQSSLSITGAGLAVAQAIDNGQAKPFPFKSMSLSDGKKGDQGALAIFRTGKGDDHQAVVIKNTSQGFGHGHFDKLNWLYYDNGNEIIRDYGAARFLNVESKYGGHYLPENNAWAKQTIAHNTLVVNETSHFNGDWKEGQKSSPAVHFFDANDRIDITSASSNGAYDGVKMTRTIALLKDDALEFPLVIDILKTSSKSKNQYDLPIHFNGHITNLTLDVTANSQQQKPLGKANGYQFLWDKSRGKATEKLPQLTWIKDKRFYTASFAKVSASQEFIFTQLGASDPDFNLRSEPAVIQRVSDAGDHTFLSVLEKHGEYNPDLEFTTNSVSALSNLALLEQDGYDIANVTLGSGKTLSLIVAYKGDETAKHSISLNGQAVNWTGFYTVFESNE